MSIIKMNKLAKRFDDVVALSDFDFESTDNEFVAIVGPSGCGKTTLLRLIAGLEKPTQGSLNLDDEEITNLSPKDRDLAMEFQSYALYPNLTVFQNLAFPLLMRNFDKKTINSEVLGIAEKLELTDLLDRKPGTLSGGQKQRVAIGRAMIRKPKAFLLDEPLSSLDAALREKMRGELISLHNSLKTLFFYVTHDQAEAMAMGDRIIVLNKGIVQQIDTPDNIYNNPANLFVAGFIGNPRINIISKSLYKLLGGSRFLTDNIVICIRPENISINSSEEDNQSCGTVLYIEKFGRERHYHIEYNGQTIIVCVGSTNVDVHISEGSRVICRGQDNAFLFFDKVNGAAIKYD